MYVIDKALNDLYVSQWNSFEVQLKIWFVTDNNIPIDGMIILRYFQQPITLDESVYLFVTVSEPDTDDFKYDDVLFTRLSSELITQSSRIESASNYLYHLNYVASSFHNSIG